MREERSLRPDGTMFLRPGSFSCSPGRVLGEDHRPDRQRAGLPLTRAILPFMMLHSV
jgi:hypothetical protein